MSGQADLFVPGMEWVLAARDVFDDVLEAGREYSGPQGFRTAGSKAVHNSPNRFART